MVGDNLNQSFGFEMGKGFANGNFADMKLVGKGILEEALASLQLTAEDLFA